jgi:hypothetical protein
MVTQSTTTPRGDTQQLSTPLAGATEASVFIKFGGGELFVEHGPDEMLVSGEFRGGVIRRLPAPGRVELEQEGWHFPWGKDEWPDRCRADGPPGRGRGEQDGARPA